ncbi:MAG: ARPP-1 family domain-containing protein [Fimbriimonadales bacterium]
MKLAIAALAALAIFGCGQKSQPQPAAQDARKAIEGVEGYALGDPVTYENATFVPVLSTKEPNQEMDDTITLSEAKKNKWVEIIEVPGDEQVSRLKVRNVGPKPLLLLGGELLLGGKQDRVVAKDTIIPPGETKDVEVFCVERGRWEGASTRFDYGGTMIPDRVRKAAQYEGQERVWAGVSEMNENVSQDLASTPHPSSIRAFLGDEAVQGKVKSEIGHQFRRCAAFESERRRHRVHSERGNQDVRALRHAVAL